MYYIGLDELLLSALKEDIGTGDITTTACVSPDARSKAALIAKAEGVICGIAVFRRVFELIDPSIRIYPLVSDGERVSKNDIIAELSGPSGSMLTGERVALNFLQRLSGIATRTAQAASEVSGTGAKIVDTRKTTPNLRILEKYAVKTGGGFNHRFNLSDGILIKDNHIVAAGGIKAAIDAARSSAPHTLKIEIEAETIPQVEEAVLAGADIIMLDNMDMDNMASSVRLIAGRALTEASGNMDSRNLRQVAETGVDFISMGALTHSVISMDISLKFHD